MSLNWTTSIYAALMVHPLFTKLVWNYFEKDNVKIVESKRSEYSLFGKFIGGKGTEKIRKKPLKNEKVVVARRDMP